MSYLPLYGWKVLSPEEVNVLTASANSNEIRFIGIDPGKKSGICFLFKDSDLILQNSFPDAIIKTIDFGARKYYFHTLSGDVFYMYNLFSSLRSRPTLIAYEGFQMYGKGQLWQTAYTMGYSISNITMQRAPVYGFDIHSSWIKGWPAVFPELNKLEFSNVHEKEAAVFSVIAAEVLCGCGETVKISAKMKERLLFLNKKVED